MPSQPIQINAFVHVDTVLSVNKNNNLVKQVLTKIFQSVDLEN